VASCMAMVDALLAHLGLEARPAPDAEGLARAHRRLLERVPYDGLTAQLGEHGPLDAARLIERTVTTGRAGYCFEINTVLAALLEGLGFVVERREGVVGERGASADGAPTNHLALVVRAGDEAFICDAGWGEGFLAPLPLAAGSWSQGPLTWVVERGGDGWWVQQHMWGSSPGFRFGDEVVGIDAFAGHHERLATTPDSSFVQTLVVQKPLEDRVVTLRARTLSEKGPQVDAKRVLADEDALATTLRDTFNMNLDAGRIGRLWAAACAQHEDFVRRSASTPASAPPAPGPPASA
jgi:N-hydroxyarylamine O-acetyltransferase